MKRVALYVRVSTAEQRDQGISVESQIEALRAYCRQNGYTEAGLYNDAGVSARCSYKRRPGLLQMIQDCQDKKIDLIIVTKLDRFFRSVPDYYAVMEQVGAVPWRAIWEDYETETSSGIFKVNIMLSIAQAESDRTSERIKAVNEYRKAQGQVVAGSAPLGYTIRKGDIFKNELVRDAVSTFFAVYLQTTSPTKAIDAAAEYGVNISRPQALRMLKSEVYAGNAYGCSCDAYITTEEHQYILGTLEGRKTRRTNFGRVYYFSGILRCPICHGTMASHYISCKVHGKKYQYKAYRCSSYDMKRGCTGKKVVFESTLEKYLIKNVFSLMNEYLLSSSEDVDKKASAEKQIAKLREKLKRIGDRYEDGDISRDEYRKKRQAITSEIESLLPEVVTTQVEQLPEDWVKEYQELDDEHKRIFWHRVLTKIEYAGDNTFNLTFR